MLPLETIISRGSDGAERAALAVARMCGLHTGGTTRITPGRPGSAVVGRYGLSADPCSRRQALLRNVRRADGTLVFGRFGRATEAMLLAEGTHYCCIERPRDGAAGRVAAWLNRHGIRTLHVVGRCTPEWAFGGAVVLLEALREGGRAPRLPEAAGQAGRAAVVAAPEGFHAVQPWPVPRAWRWDETRPGWRPIDARRGLRLLYDGTVRPEWLGPPPWALVPARVRRWVARRYPAGPYGEARVEFDLDLLEALGRLGRPAEDLARAGRWAILRLACWSGRLSDRPAEAGSDWGLAARLLAGRQRDLLGRCGFPATESAVRTLSKVTRDACTPADLLRLRDLMRDPAAESPLRRLPRVNGATIRVMSDPWLSRAVGWQLLRDVSGGGGDGPAADPDEACVLLCRLQNEAERTGWPGWSRAIESVGALERAVSELEETPDAGWLEPPRSLPGVVGVIEPLTEPAALAAEGREMRHCAARYGRMLRRGHCLMFRVLPDAARGTGRATLQLRPGPAGVWRVAQLYGPHNSPPDDGTVRFVQAWLQEMTG